MMNTGKVPEAVLKRSIIRKIQYTRPEVLVGAGIGEDCAALELEPDEVFVISTDPITGAAQEIGKLAIHITANDLASAGAEPVAVLLTILLPPNSEEELLKQIMEDITDNCNHLKIQVAGGHTEVTPVVNQPLVSITGVGKCRKDRLITTSGAKPGQDVLITKWIGLEGTAILANEKTEQLAKKFPKQFLDTAKAFMEYISVVPEARIAVENGVSAMHDVTEGGIFGALWEMAQASQVGLDIDMRKIPLRQETVEICEFFEISPYELISSGSMLMTADNGYDLVRRLGQAGIIATVVGKTTAGNDRILWNDKEKRFLEPPKTDELYKAL